MYIFHHTNAMLMIESYQQALQISENRIYNYIYKPNYKKKVIKDQYNEYIN